VTLRPLRPGCRESHSLTRLSGGSRGRYTGTSAWCGRCPSSGESWRAGRGRARAFLPFETEVVGGAVRRAALDTAAREPHREAERIVIAAVLDAVAGSTAHFHHRRAAELGSADH